MAAAAYPHGRLLAQASGLVLNFEEAGGSTLNSGEANNKAFTTAVRYLDRKGGGTLVVPAKVYPFSGLSSCTATNVTVAAFGSTFAGNNCRIAINPGSSGYNLDGLTLIETSGDRATYLMDCRGSNCRFKDVHFEKNPPAGGYIAYCRDGTYGNQFENVSFAGSNGIFLAGHDHRVIGGEGESSFGDDCWVIKSTVNPTYNIQISGFKARHFTAIVSIGSEVGTARRDNPGRSLFVNNVLVENCTAEECSYLAYIKPGGVDAVDYRDGLVEDVSIKNCSLLDNKGERFRNGVYISPGRGSIVRRINIQDVTIRARGGKPAVQTISGLYIRPLRTRDNAGTAGSVDEVHVSGLHCTDPYGGAPTSNSAPGAPIQSLVAIEKLNPAIGHVGRIEVSDSSVDGCARMAVFLGSNLEGPISFSHCDFKNYAASVVAPTDKGSVLALSPVTLTNITATPSPSAPPDTRGVVSDALPDRTVAILGDIVQAVGPSVRAGAAATFPVYTAVRDTWISEVEITVAEPVPASQKNFARITLRNSLTGVLGAAATSDGLLKQAGVPVSLNGSLKFVGRAACIAKGSQLLVEISQHGSGVGIKSPRFTVHCVPFGAA
jgi:hypothetical protein